MKEFVVMDCIKTTARVDTIREIIRSINDIEVGVDVCLDTYGNKLDSIMPYMMKKNNEEWIACFFNCSEADKIAYEAKYIKETKDHPDIIPNYGLFFLEVPSGENWKNKIKQLYESHGFTKIGKRTKSIKEYISK